MPLSTHTELAPAERTSSSFRSRRYLMIRLARANAAPSAPQAEPSARVPARASKATPPPIPKPKPQAQPKPAAPSTRPRVAYPPPPEGDSAPRLTRNVREHCVMARVQRAGKRFQRNFTLAQLGSWEIAEAQAAAWLNTLIAKLPHPTTSKGRLTRRNRTGVVGVSFQYDCHTLKSGQTTVYPNYVAKWVGRASGVTWMFSTYGGGENAFLLACLCRQMQTSVRAEVVKALEALNENERQNLLALRRPLPAQELSFPPLATTQSAEGVNSDVPSPLASR